MLLFFFFPFPWFSFVFLTFHGCSCFSWSLWFLGIFLVFSCFFLGLSFCWFWFNQNSITFFVVFTNYSTCPCLSLLHPLLSLVCPWLSLVSRRISLASLFPPCLVKYVAGVSFSSLIEVTKVFTHVYNSSCLNII